jgi:hypothetical protein
MSKDKKIVAGEEVKTPTDKKEIEALLEAYKKVNPAKYETKKANGEFDKLFGAK